MNYKIPKLTIAVMTIGLLMPIGLHAVQNTNSKKTPPTKDKSLVRYKGTLILANGTTIDLATAPYGKITVLPGFSITIHRNRITCSQTATNSTNDTGKNKIIVPNSSLYTLELIDGTIVSLNAGSTLIFPVSFKNNRGLELCGEGYFQAPAHQKEVLAIKTGIKTIYEKAAVLDISAYPNEDISATVERGEVYFRDKFSGTIEYVRPGERLTTSSKSQFSFCIDMIAREAASCTKNFTVFSSMPLINVLWEVSRLYGTSINSEKINSKTRLTAIYFKERAIVVKVRDIPSGAETLVLPTLGIGKMNG
jgi:transmembrane sensor